MIDQLLNTRDALLVTNPTNIRYLTGFVCVAPEERESYVLVTKNEVLLFTNSLYLEQAKKLAKSSRSMVHSLQLEIVEISREEPTARKLAEITYRLKIKALGFEEDNLTVAEFKKLHQEMPSVALVGKKNIIELLRMIKKTDEINHIKKAAKLTDDCFEYILGKIKTGITENEVLWEIESFFRKHHATSAFAPVVAFGAHSSQPHYSSIGLNPGDQGSTLGQKGLILLDFGAKVNGYCGDLTRVVFLGKPKDEWRNVYKAVLEAQLAALIYLDNGGSSGAEADQISRAIIEKFGFPAYPHSLGHGVGLDIHEAPRLSMKKDIHLKPNMVISVEPGVYIEGQFGIRIEDLVCVRKSSVEILSHAPKDLIVL